MLLKLLISIEKNFYPTNHIIFYKFKSKFYIKFLKHMNYFLKKNGRVIFIGFFVLFALKTRPMVLLNNN